MGAPHGFENGFDGSPEWLALYDFREGFSYCRQKARFGSEPSGLAHCCKKASCLVPGQVLNLECHFPKVYS